MSLRVACIGECMVELRHLDADTLAMGFAGDTSNTAVYLARCGLDVEYISAVGTDDYSARMLAHWEAEGVGTAHVARIADRTVGLYLLRTDAGGERHFTYWRGESAARELFRGEVDLRPYDLVHLSGITLSILDPASRDALNRALEATAARICFDTNYRPAGWPDVATARRAVEAVLRRADVVLAGLDDERALFGDRTAEASAARLHALGVGEVVVTLGVQGCLVSTDGQARRVSTRPRAALDTAGAGDAFDAAYLVARLAGADPFAAALSGHRLAGEVVSHPGAVLPRAAMPPLEVLSSFGT